MKISHGRDSPIAACLTAQLQILLPGLLRCSSLVDLILGYDSPMLQKLRASCVEMCDGLLLGRAVSGPTFCGCIKRRSAGCLDRVQVTLAMGKYKKVKGQSIKENPKAMQNMKMECYNELNRFFECMAVRFVIFSCSWIGAALCRPACAIFHHCLRARPPQLVFCHGIRLKRRWVRCFLSSESRRVCLPRRLLAKVLISDVAAAEVKFRGRYEVCARICGPHALCGGGGKASRDFQLPCRVSRGTKSFH